MKTLLVCGCLATAGAIVSCGSSNTTGGDGGTTTGDGSTMSDSGINPNAKFLGSIAIQSTDAKLGMMDYKSYAASGIFMPTPMGSSSFCTTSMDGPCTIYDCMFADAGVDAGTPQTLGAGMVSIDVNGAAPIALTKMGNNTYFAQ